MNRTVKEATLKADVLALVTAVNIAKHLKAVRWRTRLQTLCDAWNREPTRFKVEPRHLIPGTNT